MTKSKSKLTVGTILTTPQLKELAPDLARVVSGRHRYDNALYVGMLEKHGKLAKGDLVATLADKKVVVARVTSVNKKNPMGDGPIVSVSDGSGSWLITGLHTQKISDR